VHARRDLTFVREALATMGLRLSPQAAAMVRARHRALDRNSDPDDARLHFMRGEAEEPGDVALKRCLAYLEARARRAVGALARARAAKSDEVLLAKALEPLADVVHAVRDSYSRGHSRRAPGPGGPEIVALHSWGQAASPEHAFGLIHALVHDRRFEVPFSFISPEVPASDRAVQAALSVLALAASAPRPPDGFDAGWTAFVRSYLRPDGPRPPAESARSAEAAADKEERPEEAAGSGARG
jgi:hypothetical protein